MRRWAAVAVLLGAAASGACGQTTAPPSMTTVPTKAPALAVRAIGASGPVLVDQQGRTLYVEAPSSGQTASCGQECQATWPPMLAPRGVVVEAGSGVDAGRIGTQLLDGGLHGVTYAGRLLHTYVGDSHPGQINGQAVQSIWFTVSPNGQPTSG